MKKMVVVGLDGIDSSFLFDQLDTFPNIKQVVHSGKFGTLKGCHPPSFVHGWVCMVTGGYPGQTGVYDGTQRTRFNQYHESPLDCSFIKEPTLWEILGKHRYRSILLGVPLSNPLKTVNDYLISCSFSKKANHLAYPEDLSEELYKEVGDYLLEVNDVTSLYKQSKQRFKIARYLLTRKEWDFFMMVDTSIRHFRSLSWDEGEQLYRYYKYLDEEIGSILKCIPPHTPMLITSTCGLTKTEGVFHLNEWLLQEGYLKLKETIQEPRNLTTDVIDWKQTRAWGKGGSFGCVWLNVQKRETEGVIPKERYEYIRNKLIHKLISVTDKNGVPLYIKALKPSKIHSKVVGIPMDLLLYICNSKWRASSKIGTGKIHSGEVSLEERVTSTPTGFYISSRNLAEIGGECIDHVQIMDLAPTILNEFAIQPLKEMKGNVISLFK